MKKSELVLGNVVKAYKGETEYEITLVSEDVVILNGEKEVKTSTLLKNYKLVKEAEAKVEVEEGPKSEEVEALVAEIEERENEREFLDEVDKILGERAGYVEEADTDPVVESEPEVESTENVEDIEENVEVEPVNNETETENKPKEKKEKEVIYGIKVSTGVNQTLIWKVLKKVCENKDEEGIRIANELKEKYPETFSGAVRCLVSKKRINYIDSIC